MSFDPKINRNNKDAIGDPGDSAATDTTTPWTMVSLLKGILAKLTTGIAATVTGVSTEAKQDAAITQETAINTVLGTTAGAAVTTDANGTIQQYLRGIVSKLVSGITVATHAVTQSGTWTVQPGNTANTTAWKVDGSAVTQPTSLAAATNASTAAYATNLVVKASAGTLYGLSGHNSKTSAQFIQIHDAASLPSDTAVPKVIILVQASTSYAIDFGPRGRAFGTGIVICNSSTGPTKTIGSADIWADAQYA